jgi:hypothetical protein
MRKNLRSTLVPRRVRWCPGRDLNPHSAYAKKDFKSDLTTYSGTIILYFQVFPLPQARRIYDEFRVRHTQNLRSELGSSIISHCPS